MERKNPAIVASPAPVAEPNCVALNDAAQKPVGSVVQWQNPKTPQGGTGNSGMFMVTGQQPMQLAPGVPASSQKTCKSLSQEYVVEGQKTSSSLTLCNSPPSKEWVVAG